MTEESYVLSPASPVRTFRIVAVADGIGAVLLGLGVALGKWYLIIPGILVMVIGAGLIVATVVLGRRVTTKVVLDRDRIMITSGGRTASAAWSEINDVSTAGQTIYLNRHDQQPPLKIDSPRGAGDPVLQQLSGALVARLDQNRGYRDL